VTSFRDPRVPADVMAQVRTRRGQSEISHAAAREIARPFVTGTGIDHTFVQTGEIAHRSDVWRGLFGYGVYDTLATADQFAADALDTYLINRADTGPIADWDRLTLSHG